MTIKAIARIVPINGNALDLFYATYIYEVHHGFKGVNVNGDIFSINDVMWKVEMLPVEWDGEGLPPVGTECEMKRASEWFVAAIIHHSKRYTIIANNHGEQVFDTTSLQFRPIRSARDKAVEAMIEWKDAPTRINETYYNAVYDAIAAGKIPGVKLSD